MLVALRALDLLAEKQPGGDRRRGHGFVVQMSQEESRRSVFLGRAFGGDQIVNHFAPGAVAGEAFPQEMMHREPVDFPLGGPPHQEVGPLRRKMADVGGIVQKLVNFGRPLVFARVFEEMPPRHPAAEYGPTRSRCTRRSHSASSAIGRRRKFRRLPAVLDEVVDRRHDRGFGTVPGCGFLQPDTRQYDRRNVGRNSRARSKMPAGCSAIAGHGSSFRGSVFLTGDQRQYIFGGLSLFRLFFWQETQAGTRSACSPSGNQPIVSFRKPPLRQNAKPAMNKTARAKQTLFRLKETPA